MSSILPRRGRLRRPLLVLGGFAALALGSWGVAFAVREDEPLSKPKYEEKVREAYGDVQAAFQKTRGASGPELAQRVSDAQEALRDAAEELDQAKPPADVVAAHNRLVAGLREYADDLETLRVAVEAGNAEAVDRFNESVPQNKAVRQIAAAAEEMKEEGYDVGPIAEE